MAKQKVLLLGQIEHAVKEWEDLSSLAELSTPESQSRVDFLRECKDGRLNGTSVIFRTFHSVQFTGRFDEELIGVLPDSLKFICHNGAGYDQIDVIACTKRGIRVSNVANAVNDATADTNLFLILGALRGFNSGIFALRQGTWRGSPPARLGHDPEGKTLGILGMGGIGKNLRNKVQPFGMKIIYHNRRRLDEEEEKGVNYVGFEELLQSSDVISLNLPLNSNTRHMISTEQFSKMKKGVVIVNTARGAIMDEKALVRALEDGHVWSCGLDVYEDEPEIHPGLINNPNVMLIPHMGTWTVETLTAMERCSIGNVRAALETGRLRNPVPEQRDL